MIKFYLIFISMVLQSSAAEWSTYFGGSANDTVTAIAYHEGYYYITGSTQSTSGIASPNSYQALPKGGEDAFIAKFTHTGTLVWSTYFGGTANDQGLAVAVDDISGRVIIAGKTSSDDLPLGQTPKQSVPGGALDAFYAAFDLNGEFLSSSYFGGPGDDFFSHVAVSEIGGIYLAGETKSEGLAEGSLVTQKELGGQSDVLAVHISPDGSRDWASYYGGSGTENLGDMKVSGNALYLVGRTNSSSHIAVNGKWQQSLQGAFDGFVMKMSGEGETVWGGYYGGTENDNILSLDVRDGGFIMLGTTVSNLQATPDAFITTKRSGRDVFWTRVSADDKIDYLSFLGTNNAASIIYNDLGGYYIYGSTAVTAGMTLSPELPDKIEGAGAGNSSEAYVYLFDSKNTILYGRLFGSTGTDVAFSIALNGNGKAAMTGAAGGTSKLVSANPHQKEYGGGATDGFVTILPVSYLFLTIPNTKICTHDLVNIDIIGLGIFLSNTFYVELSDAAGSFANSVIIDSLKSDNFGSITFDVDNFISAAGTYKIRCRSSYQNLIGPEYTFTVSELALPEITGTDIICNTEEPGIYTIEGTYESIEWKAEGGDILSGQSTNSVSVKWSGAGSGLVTVKCSEATCTGTKEFAVTIAGSSDPVISGDDDVCSGNEYSYSVDHSGSGISWEIEGGTITGESTGETIGAIWAKGAEKGSLKVIIYNDECSDTAEYTVTINDMPAIALGSLPSFCADDAPFPLEGSAAPAGGIFTVNGIISTAIIPAELPIGNNTVKYVYESGDCVDSVSADFEIFPLPAKPLISEDGTYLVSSHTGKNTWYKNGMKLDSEGNSIVPDGEGVYTCMAESDKGCISGMSDPYVIKGTEQTPLISVNDEAVHHDLKCGEELAGSFEIWNTGTAPLTISSLQAEGLLLQPSQDVVIQEAGSAVIEYEASSQLSGYGEFNIGINSNAVNMPFLIKQVTYTSGFASIMLSTLELKNFAVKDVPGKDTAVINITNSGNLPAEVVCDVTDDGTAFSIIEKNILVPGKGVRQLKVIFSPQEKGIFFGSIKVRNVTCPEEFEVSLWGQAGTEFITPFGGVRIKGDTARGRTGDTVNTMLELEFVDRELEDGEVFDLEYILTFNRTLLEVLGAYAYRSVDGRDCSVKCFSYGTAFDNKILLKHDFVLSLGNDSLTHVTVDSLFIHFARTEIESQEKAAVFLLDLCMEGSPRLLQFDEMIEMDMNPNPAASHATVVLNAIEKGSHKIELVNAAGEVVRTILSGDIGQGKKEYEVSFDNISNGKYFLVLHTPTYLKSFPVEIRK